MAVLESDLEKPAGADRAHGTLLHKWAGSTGWHEEDLGGSHTGTPSVTFALGDAAALVVEAGERLAARGPRWSDGVIAGRGQVGGSSA